MVACTAKKASYAPDSVALLCRRKRIAIYIDNYIHKTSILSLRFLVSRYNYRLFYEGDRSIGASIGVVFHRKET